MISLTTVRVLYTGDGSTVAFPVPFPFFDDADLEVTERTIATGAEAVKALGTDYTIAGGEGATGTVTAAVAPTSAVQWIIRRTTARTQTKDLVSNDDLPAEAVEEALDRAAMRDQELDDAILRSLRFPASDDTSLDAELPTSVDRADKFLKFDSLGRPTVSIGVTELAVSLPLSIANGGTGTTSAAAARAALAAAGLADNNLFTGTARFQAATSLESADAGAGEGPTLNLDRLSASPAASDVIGALALRGKDSGGNTDTYAKLSAQILDPTDGSEDANLLFQTMVAGALGTRGFFGAGFVVGNPTGGDPGAGGINAESVKIQNKAVTIPSYAKITQQVASGSAGGATVATTWTKCPINTEVTDGDGILTVDDANDRFTLTNAGTYRIRATQVAAGNPLRMKLRLRNITDAATTIAGDYAGGEGGQNIGRAELEGEFTIAGSKTYELQYWASAVAANGLGVAATSGEVEVYCVLEIWKVA